MSKNLLSTVRDTEQTPDTYLVLRLRIRGVTLFAEIHGVEYNKMDTKFAFYSYISNEIAQTTYNVEHIKSFEYDTCVPTHITFTYFMQTHLKTVLPTRDVLT